MCAFETAVFDLNFYVYMNVDRRARNYHKHTHTHNAHYEIETNADSDKMFCDQILFTQTYDSQTHQAI